MLIEVTEEDITYGLPSNCYHCPIARAFGRKGINVAVGDKVLHIRNVSSFNGFAKNVRLPLFIENWRRSFDHNALNEMDVVSKPFSFEWDEVRNEFI